MPPPTFRRAFIHTALVLLVVFAVTGLLSALVLYLVLGHNSATAGGGIILLILPLLIAVSATQAVARLIRPKSNPVLKWVLQKVVQTPFGRQHYAKAMSHGIYACLKCLHIGLGAPPDKCPQCGEPIPSPESLKGGPAAPPDASALTISIQASTSGPEPDADTRPAEHPLHIPDPVAPSRTPAAIESQFNARPTNFNDPS